MAGKKRRKNRPAPAQQAVPVRRGNEQVRYVQPGRPASYPGAGQAYEQPVAQEGKKRKPRHFYDYSLLFIIIFLTVFGLVMIYSASSYTAQLSSKYNGNSACRQGCRCHAARGVPPDVHLEPRRKLVGRDGIRAHGRRGTRDGVPDLHAAQRAAARLYRTGDGVRPPLRVLRERPRTRVGT